MRNSEECVSLTFFVECICTSCSSNLKQPTDSLIESSPWCLSSGAQVSPKKQHVHVNVSNDHMFQGVDPQPVCMWSPRQSEDTNHFGEITGHKRCRREGALSAWLKWLTDHVLKSFLSLFKIVSFPYSRAYFFLFLLLFILLPELNWGPVFL